MIALTPGDAEAVMAGIYPAMAPTSSLASGRSMYYILVLAAHPYPAYENDRPAYTDRHLAP